MGQGKSTCCSSNVPCCTKTVVPAGGPNSGGEEIKGATPAEYPGLSADDQLAKKGGDDAGTPGGSPGKAVEDTDTPATKGAAGVDTEETYEDGSTYTGQLVEGRRHGTGVWTSPSEQYSGQWQYDQRHGSGRQTWQDGRLYEGQFCEGKFDGKGRMEWHTPNGLMVYEGQYVNDVKHGEGKYKWPDNRIYDGQWVNGKRSGKAKYTNLSGEVKDGIWKDDRIDQWLEEEKPQP